MAMMTEPRETSRRDSVLVCVLMNAKGLPVFEGGLVCVNALGGAVPAGDEPNRRFMGVAYETKLNGYEESGIGQKIRLWRKGLFLVDSQEHLDVASDVGREVCVVDDHTVSAKGATANNVRCGKIVTVEDEMRCWIEIDEYTPVAR